MYRAAEQVPGRDLLVLPDVQGASLELRGRAMLDLLSGDWRPAREAVEAEAVAEGEEAEGQGVA